MTRRANAIPAREHFGLRRCDIAAVNILRNGSQFVGGLFLFGSAKPGASLGAIGTAASGNTAKTSTTATATHTTAAKASHGGSRLLCGSR